MNPENKCANLFNDVWNEHPEDKLTTMYEMQKTLQERLPETKPNMKAPSMMSFKERIDQITIEWRNFNTEMTELLERLPFKEWKTYSEEQLSGFIDDEHKYETWYEYIDCMHFFFNIGIMLGLTPRDIFNLYMTKNLENFNRQKRGY